MATTEQRPVTGHTTHEVLNQPPPLEDYNTFVTDAALVAGKWEGIMRRVPSTRKDDWLTVVIAPDGRYRFSSARTIGVFRDEGDLVAADGKLTTSSERGSIDVALYEAGERRMLKVKGHTPRGEEYFADLTPAP